MRTALYLLFLCTTLIVSGCGQKGPLYLPDQAQAQDSDAKEAQADR